jgi:hypothetical protein
MEVHVSSQSHSVHSGGGTANKKRRRKQYERPGLPYIDILPAVKSFPVVH